MFPTLRLFPESASTAAERLDVFMLFMVSVSTGIAFLIAVLILYFSVKYRRRPGNESTPKIVGSLTLEVIWTLIPAVVGLVMFAWGASLYFFVARPPADAMNVFVVAKQWMWKIQHPEGQREINELHVPVGQPVKVTLTSEDVIHSFFVPAFRVKVDVLPGRYVQTWFQATKTGRFHLFCSQYCGTNHSGMVGTIVVMHPQDYQAWLQKGAEGSMAMEGRKLFFKYQCISCHSGDALARGPVLEGLFGRTVPLREGGAVTANENYLRESIINPDGKVVAGYEPIMPSFQGQIPEEEILKLIAFMAGLGQGQTPQRIDQAAPPSRTEDATPAIKHAVPTAESGRVSEPKAAAPQGNRRRSWKETDEHADLPASGAH